MRTAKVFMQKHKILLVIQRRHLLPLYRALRDRVEWHAVVHRQYDDTEADQYYTLKRWSFGALWLKHRKVLKSQIPYCFLGLRQVLNTVHPQTIIASEAYQWYTLQLYRYKRAGGAGQLYIYSETKQWPKSMLARMILRFFMWQVRRNVSHISGVFVYCSDSKQWWREQVPELPVSVVPAPVDIAQFYPAKEKDWLPQGVLRILVNARYIPVKRHQDIFAAVQELQAKGRSVQVSCIGRGEVGRERIERMVEEIGLRESVRFLDTVSRTEMPALYHAHDVLLLPSSKEAIGMVVPEAMACGVPTITSNAVGANTYVKDGETGLIFKTKDVADLTEKLEQCFDAKRLADMGTAARAHVQNFSTERIADTFMRSVAGKH